jgi:hypothetical protein
MPEISHPTFAWASGLLKGMPFLLLRSVVFSIHIMFAVLIFLWIRGIVCQSAHYLFGPSFGIRHYSGNNAVILSFETTLFAWAPTDPAQRRLAIWPSLDTSNGDLVQPMIVSSNEAQYTTYVPFSYRRDTLIDISAAVKSFEQASGVFLQVLFTTWGKSLVHKLHWTIRTLFKCRVRVVRSSLGDMCLHTKLNTTLKQRNTTKRSLSIINRSLHFLQVSL